MARDGVLPRFLASRGARSGAPAASSLLQSGLSLAVIVWYAWRHDDLDPVNQLFYWGGGLGGIGIVALLVATSISVTVHFGRRRGDGQPVWKWLVAPTISALALAALLVLMWRDFHHLIAVAPDDPLRWFFPAALAAAAVLGAGWAMILKTTKPKVYEEIGLGAKTVAGIGIPLPRRAVEPVEQVEA